MIIERWSLLLVEHVPAIVPEILARLAVHWHQVRTAPRLAINRSTFMIITVFTVVPNYQFLG